jgi:uncharacterized membrane protein
MFLPVLWVAAWGLEELMALFSKSASPLREAIGKILTYGGRWLFLAAELAVAVIATVLSMKSVTVTDKFRSDHSAFFQTTAQVQAGVLIAFAATKWSRAARPAALAAVLLGAIALVAGVAGTSPLLPRALHDWAFGLSIGGGAGSVVALVFVSWSW